MKLHRFRRMALIAFGAALALPPVAAGFDFDEMQQLEQAEQADLLAEAKKAARAWEFDKAEGYLRQAEQKGFASGDLQAARDLVKDERQAKADKEQRERELAEQKQREEEARRQAAAQQERRDASGNMGGELRCWQVGKDFALYNYCERGDCTGFSGDYGLYRLCQYNDPDGLSSNFGLWRYLKEGDISGMGSDVSTYRAAKKYSGSFADRKRWVIFKLRGYLYGHM